MISQNAITSIIRSVKIGNMDICDAVEMIYHPMAATRKEIHELCGYVIRNMPKQPQPLPKGDYSMTTQEAQELAIIKQAFTDLVSQVNTLNGQVTTLQQAAAANETVPDDVQGLIDGLQTITIAAAPNAPAEVAAAAASLAKSSAAPEPPSAPSGS